MNAMAAANGGGALVFMRPFFQASKQTIKSGQHQISGPGQLNGQGCVQNVRRCHTLMHKPRILANMFGKVGQKGNNIMFGFALNFVNAINFKGAALPNCGGRFGRNNTKFCLRVTRMGFNFKPNLELAFLRPNGGHFRPGIPRDHANNTFCFRRRQVVALRQVKSQNLTSICGQFGREHTICCFDVF